MSPTKQPSRLVRGDRHQPRAEETGIAERRELSPGDGPRRLDGILREFDLGGHEVGHPDHVVVVRGHDAREGDRIPGGGGGHESGERRPRLRWWSYSTEACQGRTDAPVR